MSWKWGWKFYIRRRINWAAFSDWSLRRKIRTIESIKRQILAHPDVFGEYKTVLQNAQLEKYLELAIISPNEYQQALEWSFFKKKRGFENVDLSRVTLAQIEKLRARAQTTEFSLPPSSNLVVESRLDLIRKWHHPLRSTVSTIPNRVHFGQTYLGTFPESTRRDIAKALQKIREDELSIRIEAPKEERPLTKEEIRDLMGKLGLGR